MNPQQTLALLIMIAIFLLIWLSVIIYEKDKELFNMGGTYPVTESDKLVMRIAADSVEVHLVIGVNHTPVKVITCIDDGKHALVTDQSDSVPENKRSIHLVSVDYLLFTRNKISLREYCKIHNIPEITSI